MVWGGGEAVGERRKFLSFLAVHTSTLEPSVSLHSLHLLMNVSSVSVLWLTLPVL